MYFLLRKRWKRLRKFGAFLLLFCYLGVIKQNFFPNFVSNVITRRQLVNLQCNTLSDTKRQSLSTYAPHILHFKEQDLVWCPVLKGSSRTWREFLFQLQPNISQNKKSEIYAKVEKTRITNYFTDEISIKTSADKLKSTAKSFIIVRHPFNRIVSAFRDKFEQVQDRIVIPEKDYFYRTYGSKMVRNFRQLAMEKFGSEFFSEENSFGAPIPVPKNKRTKNFPIFWEFVQFLKTCKLSDMDEHWIPISLYCSVCGFEYETIIRFENLQTESKYLREYLLQGTKGESKVEIFDHYKYDYGKSDEDIKNIYMSQLDQEDIEFLYKMYRDDFLLFGYQI